MAPPSIIMFCPDTKRFSCDRNIASLAISTGSATRPRGVMRATISNSSGGELVFIGVFTIPGEMEFTVILYLPNFFANAFVWQIAPALLEVYAGEE